MRSLALALMATVGSVWGYAQPVSGQVVSYGFQTSNAPVIRAGQWFPILVSLQSQGTDVLAGELRIECIDLDGDRVAFRRTQVALSGASGKPRRFWCYAAVNESGELPDRIHLIDERTGRRVLEIPMPLSPVCECLHGEDLLVLDISNPAVDSLNIMTTATWAPGARPDHRRFYRNVVVARAPASDLPDRWCGLEAVDVIVWDTPRPSELSVAQLDALIDWVRSGGELIVGVGVSWEEIRTHESALPSIMPLAGEGAPIAVTALPDLFDKFAPPSWTRREFRAPVSVCTADLAEGALPLHVEYGPNNQPLRVISVRHVGSGRVIALGTGLRDLTGAPLEHSKFYALLLEMNAYSADFARKVEERSFLYTDRTEIHRDLITPVDFRSTTAMFSLAAFLFIGAYVAIATLGTWWWLRRKRLAHASWATFAGCAVLASGLSLGTVYAVRGFSGGVRSLNIIDLDPPSPASPGVTQARGFAMFGYRSATRKTTDFALPGDDSYLRPMARGPTSKLFYVTPTRYAAQPGRAQLDDVLIRATLKQFEGYWQGQVEGSLRGSLTVDRGTGRLLESSWITNDLPFRIDGGYLIFIDPRQKQGAGVPWTAAGLTKLYALPDDVAETDVEAVAPAENLLAVEVPAIRSGQRAGDLGVEQYKVVDQRLADWDRQRGRARNRSSYHARDLTTLTEMHDRWQPRTLSTRDAQTSAVFAVMRASTRDYFLHTNSLRRYETPGTPMSTDGVPDLDVTHWITGGIEYGHALLICWSFEPGPAQLHDARGRPLHIQRGMTIFRTRIPIRYQGTPPRGNES